jgi:hypothetical protein
MKTALLKGHLMTSAGNYAFRLGVTLPFVEQNNSEPGSVSALWIPSESAQEAQKVIPTS